MNQENVVDDQPVSKLKKLWANPNVKLAASVGLTLIQMVCVASFSYRLGKYKGKKQGEVKGYASALTDIGVTPAEVPTLASAWQETRTQYVEAINEAQAVAA
jgi:hypothetical protein